MSTAIGTVKITDQTVLFIHEQKERMFNALQEQIESNLPNWENIYVNAQGLNARVRPKGRDLQNQASSSNISKNELENERNGYLEEYWRYKAISEKVSFFICGIQKSIEFLTPQPRAYKEQSKLTAEQPELFKQMQYSDQICQGYIKKLTEYSSKLCELNKKNIEFLDGELGWSLQRFCQIVDQNGKPIGYVQRVWNRFGTPLVPPLQSPSISDHTFSNSQEKPNVRLSANITETIGSPLTRNAINSSELTNSKNNQQSIDQSDPNTSLETPPTDEFKDSQQTQSPVITSEVREINESVYHSIIEHDSEEDNHPVGHAGVVPQSNTSVSETRMETTEHLNVVSNASIEPHNPIVSQTRTETTTHSNTISTASAEFKKNVPWANWFASLWTGGSQNEDAHFTD